MPALLTTFSSIITEPKSFAPYFNATWPMPGPCVPPSTAEPSGRGVSVPVASVPSWPMTRWGVSGERSVRRAVWEARDEVLRFEIEANAFLRGMVRRIVAVLLDVGLGKLNEEGVREALAAQWH